MSDRPTLWVHYDYGPDGEFSDRRASRADLLAALKAERVAKYRPGYELWLVPVEADDE